MPIPGHLGADGCPSPPVITGVDRWKHIKEKKNFSLRETNAALCFVKHNGIWRQERDLVAEHRNKKTKARRRRRKALKARLAADDTEKGMCTCNPGSTEHQRPGERRRRRNSLRAARRKRRQRSEEVFRLLEGSRSVAATFGHPDRTSSTAAPGIANAPSQQSNTSQWVVALEPRHPLSFSQLLDDGHLFIVRARVNGHPVRVLVDSGATRCFVAASSVTALGLYCMESKACLELADGSKQLSKGKCPHVRITLGDMTTHADLTVTTLLHNIDIILGINWLTSVNPLIDWQGYTMYLNTGNGLTAVKCANAPEGIKSGTVKVLQLPFVQQSPTSPSSLQTLACPQFWRYTGSSLPWSSTRPRGMPTTATVSSSQEEVMPTPVLDNSDAGDDFVHTNANKIHRLQRVQGKPVVQAKSRLANSRRFITTRKLNSLVQKGEQCFLAVVRPYAK